MADLTALEQEIIEATNFKMKRFANRQDYLASIAKAMEKMPGDAYDNLSDEATDWYEEAATAVNSNDDIPDFPEEDEDGPEPEDAQLEASEAEEDVDEADDEADEGSEDDAEPEGEESEDSEEGEAEDEPKPEAKPAKKPVKAKAKSAKTNGKNETEPKDPKTPRPEVMAKMKAKKEAAAAKKGGPKKDLPKTRYDDASGNKNRYGYFEGTKVDAFCKMLEKGASMADVKDELGDTYYNTIKKLREAGHTIEKNDAGKFVLRHKDDAAPAKKAKTKG